jgi:6-methylpretetramide 4-monooxygenase / 4-hydroxy-6-methylpretetramide 12a-monooxygenase
VDVLVVGAGPSGLFAAHELARHGVRARVVDREPQPHHEARATAIQPGTLEVLARGGLVDDVLAASVRLRFARVFNANLELVSEIAFAGAGCRWEFQCSLPQWRTEQLFTAHLAELGVSVDRGVQATGMHVRDDGVRVDLRRVDGTEDTVEASYVIGAGGGHSLTRETMGQVLAGESYPGTALVGDVRVSCSLPRDGSSLVATPEGFVLLAALPEQRWITFIGDLQDDEIREIGNDASKGKVEALLKRRITAEIHLEDCAWASPFRMHSRLVSRLAGPRRFLLGDAGHLSSPFGGEGLNSGLQDGHNLGWKLALVLRGRGRARLLESFATERYAADRHVLEVSDRLHAAAYAAVEAARTGVWPPAASPETIRALVRSRAMLDVSYATSPIVGEYLASGEEPGADLTPGERYPDSTDVTSGHVLLLAPGADEVSVARLRERWSELVTVSSVPEHLRTTSGLILVRPDGHIGFRAGCADAGSIAALDAHLDSYLVPA